MTKTRINLDDVYDLGCAYLEPPLYEDSELRRRNREEDTTEKCLRYQRTVDALYNVGASVKVAAEIGRQFYYGEWGHGASEC